MLWPTPSTRNTPRCTPGSPDSGTCGGRCAITQNGFVRVASQPRYTNPVTPAQAIDTLSRLIADPRHEFWPCDIQLSDVGVSRGSVIGHRQTTDAYLFALAVRHRGRLVSPDTKIRPGMIDGTAQENLHIIAG